MEVFRDKAWILLFLACSLLNPTVGSSTSQVSATMSVIVEPYLAMSEKFSTITLNMDVLDGQISSASSSFRVSANSDGTNYNVWLTTQNENLDMANGIYLASNGRAKLPLSARFVAKSKDRSIDINPVALSRNHAGLQMANDAVFTLVLSENPNLTKIYNDIPAGVYTMSIVSNVAVIH